MFRRSSSPSTFKKFSKSLIIIVVLILTLFQFVFTWVPGNETQSKWVDNQLAGARILLCVQAGLVVILLLIAHFSQSTFTQVIVWIIILYLTWFYQILYGSWLDCFFNPMICIAALFMIIRLNWNLNKWEPFHMAQFHWRRFAILLIIFQILSTVWAVWSLAGQTQPLLDAPRSDLKKQTWCPLLIRWNGKFIIQPLS
jgi:hypothetical protein